MSYFKQISENCETLSDIADNYLKSLPYIDNDSCIKRIWDWACSQMESDGTGYFIFNGKNDFAEQIVDSGVPYSEIPTNGSLRYSLGWSVTAQEANLRSLLEFVEGRQSEWTLFECLADGDKPILTK